MVMISLLSDRYTAHTVEFLNCEASKSERPDSKLKTLCAALKHFFKAVGTGVDWDQVDTFVKALVKLGTTRPAGRTPVMPIQAFLSMFASWGSNEQLSTGRLRQKAVTLLALAAMCRPSDLSPIGGTMNRGQIKFHSSGMTVLFFGIKNDADRHGFEVQVDRVENVVICPVACMQAYLKRTENLVVGDKSPVFISLVQPFKGVNAQTIASILRESIKDAGLPDTFTARSFRPTGATAAVVGGVDPHTARSLGRWKSEQVFFERYLYPISQSSISERMFSAKLPK